MADDSERKHVRDVGDDDLVAAGPKHLWSNVAGGAALLIQQFLFADPAGEAEVGEDVGFGLIWVDPDHDILQFEVAVDDPFLPEMLDTLRDVADCLQPGSSALQSVLPHTGTTSRNSSSSVPPLRYSSTHTNSFRSMYRLSRSTTCRHFKLRSIFVSLMNVS